MDLLENSNYDYDFYTIHKMLVLLRNHLNYLKDSIFKGVFKDYNRVLFLDAQR